LATPAHKGLTQAVRRCCRMGITQKQYRYVL
jgi:hypothetical protein